MIKVIIKEFFVFIPDIPLDSISFPSYKISASASIFASVLAIAKNNWSSFVLRSLKFSMM
jgi:hypothetical protein